MKEVVLTIPRVAATTGKLTQFIRVREQQFDEDLGVATSTRTGFIEVDPNKAAKALEAFQAGKIDFQLGQFNRQTQVHEVVMLKLDVANAPQPATTPAIAPAVAS